VIYFASFFIIPFISKMEEDWLIKRGLPPEVTEMIEQEARDKEERKQNRLRRQGDIA
jgi:hypothetical protein